MLKLSWKNLIVRLASAISLVAVILSLVPPAFADDSTTDMNALVQETQKMHQVNDEMKLVWWIPEEYWRVSFAENPGVPKSQVEEFLDILRPYTVFCIVSGRVGLMGLVKYEAEADIRANVILVDAAGIEYKPVKEADVGSVTKNLLAVMKPVLSNILGPMGENMHFVLFPAIGKDKKMIANAKEEGPFTVKLIGTDFRWRLPLGALLAKKICPKCNEALTGTYNYCPYDGSKL